METSYIKEYYNNYNEDQRTKSRHGSVEFITNMKYIRDFLPAGASILDAGAGTGVYSMALAMDGYHVRAIELVEHNIEVFRANLKECGAEIPVEQGNAMDLSRFPDESFDGVLLFGPLYHLYTEEEKLLVLAEAKRLLHERGHHHPLLLPGRRQQYAGLSDQGDGDGGLPLHLSAGGPL